LSVDTALDHLIVGASSLADGVDYVAKVTGATPRRGGRHVAMGTHNALLRLGDRVYLEVPLERGGSISTTPRFKRSSPSIRASSRG